jgi:hypothetical protein
MEKFLVDENELKNIDQKITFIMNLGTVKQYSADVITNCGGGCYNSCKGDCDNSCSGACDTSCSGDCGGSLNADEWYS